MCQLLGISSNREVDLAFSLREWRHRGCSNPDGYGFAYWDTAQLYIIKRARDLWGENAERLDEVRSKRSRTFLCHVRLGSVGEQDGRNTHPFKRVLDGRHFAFAHNGTLCGYREQLQLRQLSPEGDTDSEYAFLWLLEQLSGVAAESFSVQLQYLADKVQRFGRFNFLLSDGTTLWAYADNALHFIERRPPYGGELVRLLQEGYTVALSDVKKSDERAILVATCPLTDESGWEA